MKNVVLDTYRVIKVPYQCSILLDEEDCEQFSEYRWGLSVEGYVVRTYRNRPVFFHRQIAKATKGQIVDHINRNKLDNRKSNLRIVTARQNSLNRCSNIGSSFYKRVHWHTGQRRKNRWIAGIRVDSKHYSLGAFEQERHAAMAYDIAARDLFGEYAYLNFPNALAA